jgi:hypothetical protein
MSGSSGSHQRTARSVGVCVAAVLALSLTACSDQPTATAALAPRQVSFDFADNPSSPAPIVIRRDGILVRVITTDAVQGIMAIHGPIDDPLCNDLTTRDTVDGQQILTPSDAQGIRLLLTATDMHVEVYAGTDISQVFPFVASKFCTFVASTPTLYKGLTHYTVNLGSSMTSFRWEGDATRTADGAPFHYVENQDVVDPSSGSGKTTSSFIRITQMGNP